MIVHNQYIEFHWQCKEPLQQGIDILTLVKCGDNDEDARHSRMLDYRRDGTNATKGFGGICAGQYHCRPRPWFCWLAAWRHICRAWFFGDWNRRIASHSFTTRKSQTTVLRSETAR